MHMFKAFLSIVLANVQQPRKKDFHLKYFHRKRWTAHLTDISRIGNTFIRTLTHAHYSKDVFFLVRLKASEFVSFFYSSTLMIALGNKKPGHHGTNSLLNILMGLWVHLHSYSRPGIQWRQTRRFVGLINIECVCLCNDTRVPYWWPWKNKRQRNSVNSSCVWFWFSALTCSCKTCLWLSLIVLHLYILM